MAIERSKVTSVLVVMSIVPDEPDKAGSSILKIIFVSIGSIRINQIKQDLSSFQSDKEEQDLSSSIGASS